MTIHSSILAWKTPRIKEPGGLQSVGSQRVGTQLSAHTQTHTPEPIKGVLAQVQIIMSPPDPQTYSVVTSPDDSPRYLSVVLCSVLTMNGQWTV